MAPAADYLFLSIETLINTISIIVMIPCMITLVKTQGMHGNCKWVTNNFILNFRKKYRFSEFSLLLLVLSRFLYCLFNVLCLSTILQLRIWYIMAVSEQSYTSDPYIRNSLFSKRIRFSLCAKCSIRDIHVYFDGASFRKVTNFYITS